MNSDSTTKNADEILPSWKSHLYNAEESQLSVITQQHKMLAVTTASLYDVLTYLNTNIPKLRYIMVADYFGNVVPSYHASPIHQEDPQCKNSILKSQLDEQVCCMTSCKTGSKGCVGPSCCGGTGCALRPRRSIRCCASYIIAANLTCVHSGVPWLVK